MFPRLVQWTNDVQQVASDLITEVPSLDNGGITQSPFSVTYHLNDKAIWDDGTPITCDDVNFTWLAILNTTGTYSTARLLDRRRRRGHRGGRLFRRARR